MTVIFRQRTFSKRWKIQKDWDVGVNHTTATIVENKESYCLKSDNKIAECVLSPRVDENQNAVSCIVYTKVNITD